MANRTIEKLWSWSDEARLPVVVDASSCTQGLVESAAALSERNRERHAELTILDSVQWARERLLPELEVRRRVGSLTVHPTCSGRSLGLERELLELCAALADRVLVPPSATCCGFAGDRGFLHPELTAAALADEAAEVAAEPTDVHVCNNRTCEIGLERETGETYASVIYLLEELSRPGAAR
jgi:D-lactate dehydrogenase